LIEQYGAMDQHERGSAVAGDQRAAHDGLARARWRGEDSVFMRCHRLHGALLFGTQFAAELPFDARGWRPRIVDGYGGSGVFEDVLGLGENPTGQHEAVRVPLASEEKAWRVVGRETEALLLVEDRVGEGRETLQLGDECCRQCCAWNVEHGVEAQRHFAVQRGGWDGGAGEIEGALVGLESEGRTLLGSGCARERCGRREAFKELVQFQARDSADG
jgi:hypothetical protein